jgi:hypothetical protein
MPLGGRRRGRFFGIGFFHWNAGVVPLCCRKAATNGHRVLCAAADASSLLVHLQRRPWAKRLPSPGSALAGAIFWRQRRRAAFRCILAQDKVLPCGGGILEPCTFCISGAAIIIGVT